MCDFIFFFSCASELETQQRKQNGSTVDGCRVRLSVNASAPLQMAFHGRGIRVFAQRMATISGGVPIVPIFRGWS